LTEVHDIANRANILLVIVLATAAYKLIVSNYLPVKPYLTVLDRYILLSLGMQMAVMVFVALLVLAGCKPTDDSVQAYTDRTPPSHECRTETTVVNNSAAAVLGLYMLAHLTYFAFRCHMLPGQRWTSVYAWNACHPESWKKAASGEPPAQVIGSATTPASNTTDISTTISTTTTTTDEPPTSSPEDEQITE